jgi:hypothetical protein
MSKFLDIAQEFLTSDEWPFERDDEKGLLKTGITGDGVSFRVFIDAHDDVDQLLVYIYSPIQVPEEKRLAAAEFVCRANYALKIGNFELDMSDGEVRYKTSVDVEGSQLSPTMVKNLVGVGVGMMHRYYPGLMKLIYGDQSAEACIQEIEAS